MNTTGAGAGFGQELTYEQQMFVAKITELHLNNELTKLNIELQKVYLEQEKTKLEQLKGKGQ